MHLAFDAHRSPHGARYVLAGMFGLGKTIDDAPVARGADLCRLSRGDMQRLAALRESFGREHNPLIRHIVRRTRSFLETELNPETNLPWLEPVRVELIGEGTDDALQLTNYLQQAQQAAEDFTIAL